MEIGKMDDFSLSDLAGSTAIILASCGGLLTIIFSSRCLIKCRLGFTDKCNICMCERQPPPERDRDEENVEETIIPKSKPSMSRHTSVDIEQPPLPPRPPSIDIEEP